MVSVITGANRGIGQALLHELRARGHEVVGTYRSKPEHDGRWIELDVTDAESVTGLSHKLDGEPVDLLVCNAGVYLDKGQGLADGYPAQMWADAFAVNVTGVFLTIQTLMPQLQQAGSAKIAIVSSQMGSDTRAPGGAYIYRASKAAALNLGRNLAADLKGLAIAVGVYHPGWVQTDMGGPRAAITAEESARGLADRFEALSLENTGCFENWNGTEHPY